MVTESYKPQTETEVSVLDVAYRLIGYLSEGDAQQFGHLFSGTGYYINLDGEMYIGQEQVEAALLHQRTEISFNPQSLDLIDIREIHSHCYLLLATVEIQANDQSGYCIFSITCTKTDDHWYVDLFQQTHTEQPGHSWRAG